VNGLKVALLAAGLLIVSIVNDWSALDPLIVALVALLVICWIWSRFSLVRLGLTRALSLDRVRAGETITEQITVHNRALLPKLWVEVRDYSSLPDHHASRVVSLGPRGEEAWTITTTCEQRGRFQLGPVGVRSGDPLGLFLSQRFLPVRQDLVVYPIPIDVSAIPLPAAHMSGGQTVSRSSVVPSSTIAGLRDYAPGDALNRISWTATARRGVMTVKEFDPDPTSDLWIMLDLDERGMRAVTPSERYPSLDSTEEVLVALAGSLAERALNDGRKVGLIVNRAMPVRLNADQGHRQWFRMMEMLAMAQPFGSRPLGEAIAAEARRFSRTSGLIVITASPDAGWVDAVRSLVMRRVPVSAVIVMDDAGDDAHGLDALAETLAAERVIVSRYEAGSGIESQPVWKPGATVAA
ncbi:MAG: DUF58 domain-containing protein, partial [Thermomicrobiales bacterium]